MKIFYLITKSEAGGAQTHVAQLSRHFSERGHEVAVMAFPGGWLEKEVRNFNRARFYPNYFLSNSFNPMGGLKAMRIIKQAVADFNPDLVSCHSSAAGFWGRLALRNSPATIFTAHGWGFAEGAPFLRRQMMIFAEKLAGLFCAKIICVSANDGQLARKHRIAPAEKIAVVPNGVELQNVDWDHRSYSYPLQAVFVGRLAPPKQQLLLLEALSELPEETANRFGVLLIGDGPEKDILEAYVQKMNLSHRVRLLGHQDRHLVLETLKLCHFFVFLSRWEGFPRSVLEAMSCGLAVIASDVGAVREAVTAGCGRLISRNDKEALKAALADLVSDPGLIKKMGQEAQAKVRAYFSLEQMIAKTEEVYLSLAAR